MNDALHIAATGMQAQQLGMNTIANNLANVNTTGFKRGRVSFTDLMVREAAAVQPPADAELAQGPLAAVPQLGSGVGVAGVSKVFEAGALRSTGSAFDVAVVGDGFLEVVLPDGSRAFTRSGSLEVNAEGLLVSEGGHPLRPGITVPANATAIMIDKQGRVRLAVPDRPAPVDAGQLELVRFANPAGLLAQGESLYRASDASGEPIAGTPGEDGVGTVAQGYLEASNVKLVDEMVSLVMAQRAYEASVKVVQAADEMLSLVNGLRR